MNRYFYERLESKGFLSGTKVNEARIAQASLAEIADVALESAEITQPTNFEPSPSLFTHWASLSLGGGRHYCSSLDCRTDRAFELAQFALLYSDRIYVNNFFADHLAAGDLKAPIDQVRRTFHEDLVVLNLLRPVIEEGAVVPLTPPSDFCPHCLANRHLGADARQRLEAEFKKLLQQFSTEVSATLDWEGNIYGLELRGPDRLIAHGFRGIAYVQLPPELQAMTTLLRHAQEEPTNLSRNELQQIQMPELLASEVIENIALELVSAQSLNTSFLTERSLHIEVLNAISQDQSLERRNHIAKEHLTTIVPFLSNISVPQLLKLRREESETFVLFRKSLTDAIKEYRGQGEDFTERDARELFSDVIAPRLANLDNKVTTARKRLVRDTIRDAASWLGAISFGVYAGFLPADLVGAAQAIGLTKVAADLLKGVMDQGSIERDLRSDEMYFLWKVRKASRSNTFTRGV